MHNSSRSCGAVSLSGDTAQRTAPHGCLVATFCTYNGLSRLDLTFDLILIGGRGIVIDYPCVKFGDFYFSRFGLTCGQTYRYTHRQTESRMIAILTRLAFLDYSTYCDNCVFWLFSALLAVHTTYCALQIVRLTLAWVKSRSIAALCYSPNAKFT